MYQLYSRIDRTNKRAPSKISLGKDYELIGEVEASTRTDAVSKWMTGEDYYGDKIATPEVGDVLMDPLSQCYIFTPQGLWALVSNTQ